MAMRQDTRPTDECHDINVFPAANIAAGACSGNGILFDISDPLNPTRIDVVSDSGLLIGTRQRLTMTAQRCCLLTNGAAARAARCRAYDPLDWGADAIYDIVDGKLIFKSYFKIPAPQLEQENCVAHNSAIVPVPGRPFCAGLVSRWYLDHRFHRLQ